MTGTRSGFYCHGGKHAPQALLQVGGPREHTLLADNLRDHVRWVSPGPLVFINGCRTTAVEPMHEG